MNIFQQVKAFFSLFEIGEEVTRKELLEVVPRRFGTYTLDSYRLHFTHAGYLKHIGRGKYEKAKNIPEELTSRELRKQAYPHYRNWEEYKHLK